MNVWYSCRFVVNVASVFMPEPSDRISRIWQIRLRHVYILVIGLHEMLSLVLVTMTPSITIITQT